MSGNISRRNFVSFAAAGTVLGLGLSKTAKAWAPGPDENLKRDLTPGNTPVRIGWYLNKEKDKSLTETIKSLKEQDYRGLVTNPAFIDTLSDSELRELNAALKTYDVVVFEVGAYTNMLHPDKAEREKNLKSLSHAIEAADKVNCPQIGTISGSLDPVNFFNVTPKNWTNETWNLLVSGCKQVLRDTSGMKASIGMEAQVTTNIDGPKAHKRLMNDVGDPRVAVNLDPVNMIHLYNYYHTTELLNECFDTLGESILGAHSKDTYIWPDKQTVHIQEVASGRGVMDYETYLVRLSKMKWPRTLLPEHVSTEELLEGVKYIKKIAAKVGVKIYT
jgi:sugar phosphate isomerase/epimerase